MPPQQRSCSYAEAALQPHPLQPHRPSRTDVAATLQQRARKGPFLWACRKAWPEPCYALPEP